MSGMGFVDRLYVAWRVLCGAAVKVDVTFYGARDHEMTVTYSDRKVLERYRAAGGGRDDG
jgi:hypothetical protein